MVTLRFVLVIVLSSCALSAQIAPRPSATASTMSYTAQGTGAVATTQDEVNQRRVNVFDYLTSAQRANVLSGTMAEDLTTNVQKAITHAAIKGGAVFFPRGAYAFNLVITQPGVNIECESWQGQSTFPNYFTPWDITKPVIWWGNDTSRILGAYMANVTLQAQGPNGTGQLGFVSTGGLNRFTATNFSSRHFTDHCLKITGGATYENEYINFFGINIDSNDTGSARGIGLYYGATWTTAIYFHGITMGCGSMGGTSYAIYSDSVIFDTIGGWLQLHGGNAIKFTNTWGNPRMRCANTDIEVNPVGGVMFETYNTTKLLSDVVTGSAIISNGGLLKLSDASTVTPAANFKIPYQSEIQAPFLAGGTSAYFAHSSAPTDANCLIDRAGTGNNDLRIRNLVGNTGLELRGSQQLVLCTANGTNVWVTSASASGVNYFQLANGTTGNGPAINAVGSDTNVNLDLAAKGTGNVRVTTGDLVVNTIGKGLRIPTGSNARMGAAVLVAGTVTVSNTAVTANSLIFTSRSTTGGTVGHLSYTKSAGVSFTINSSSASDTSTVNWLIIEPS